MKQRIFVLRHGQDRDNVHGILNGTRDMPLTPLGKRQASKAGIRLKGKGITVVCASPQKRAKATAKLAMEKIGIPAGQLKLYSGLKERECGLLTGKYHKDIYAMSLKMFCCPNGIRIIETAPGAETLPALYCRAKKTLRKLKQDHPSQTLLLVTHGHTGMMLRAAYYNMGWRRAFAGNWQFKNATFFELSGKNPTTPYGK